MANYKGAGELWWGTVGFAAAKEFLPSGLGSRVKNFFPPILFLFSRAGPKRGAGKHWICVDEFLTRGWRRSSHTPTETERDTVEAQMRPFVQVYCSGHGQGGLLGGGDVTCY